MDWFTLDGVTHWAETGVISNRQTQKFKLDRDQCRSADHSKEHVQICVCVHHSVKVCMSGCGAEWINAAVGVHLYGHQLMPMLLSNSQSAVHSRCTTFKRKWGDSLTCSHATPPTSHAEVHIIWLNQYIHGLRSHEVYGARIVHPLMSKLSADHQWLISLIQVCDLEDSCSEALINICWFLVCRLLWKVSKTLWTLMFTG